MGPWYGRLMMLLLFATSTAACLPKGPLGEARERVARENVQIRQEPIFAPPPGATKLGGFDDEPSIANTRA